MNKPLRALQAARVDQMQRLRGNAKQHDTIRVPGRLRRDLHLP